ncbi:alkaline phosphatase [Caulobacter sp. UNC279MFTsu5.1]|uniref:alkaline phosphatase D family protein n=1 Tax=Caulobacter sp. UNC279MFTsu5.1 TaxID=1502775 RepID=UPI0008F0BEB7|nr:alkaline phosphatase D family protein [Caulobacter sp. UNC279MFTsu5.1]SFK16214.1 alkaline phosphatase D [Caulobacter sp. UNC279MFTsu5.1]
MTIDRRRALALFGLGGAGAAGEAVAAKPRTYFAGRAAFLHGAASGDPLEDRVVLWTRITAEATTAPIAVRWDVATDPGFKAIVRQGQATAVSARDYTVKVDVTGLKPATDYFYRFRYVRNGKPVGKGVGGRTRTLPKGQVRDVVLAVVSCSLYPNGYFNAYDAVARLPRVDAVLHLGDYIYEYGAAPDDYGMASPTARTRVPDPPRELLSLDDYRRRHALYKTDPALQAAHARAPWIVVWDDHETADNSWIGGAENHQPATEGDWAKRKAAGIKAYYEWMPIREPAAGTLPEASWRRFQFGDVVTLLMTETRLTARTHQLDYAHDLPIKDGKPDVAAFVAKLNDPDRRMMGQGQEQWLAREVDASIKAGTAWQVLGNQVVMARVVPPDLKAAMGEAAYGALLAKLPAYVAKPVEQGRGLSLAGLPGNLDAWDGYPADRTRVHDIFKAYKARPIVLSGDSHAFWANELWDDAGATRVAAEFGVTSVTSPGYGDYLPGAPLDQAYAARNKEVKFTDQSAKGFLLLTLEHGRATGELIAVSTILDPKYETRVLKRFVVTPGDGGGVKALAEG